MGFKHGFFRCIFLKVFLAESCSLREVTTEKYTLHIMHMLTIHFCLSLGVSAGLQFLHCFDCLIGQPVGLGMIFND